MPASLLAPPDLESGAPLATSSEVSPPLSRMMLGTVQFGLPYGVANRTGQPEYAEILRIIAAAIEGGVNRFDTAAAYGTSEEVLGRALQELKVSDQVTVVTKVFPLSPEELQSSSAARAAIESSIDTSRRRLQRDSLPIVLFHREIDAAHLEALEALQQRGWIGQIGLSCDNFPGPARSFSDTGRFSALQIPANIVDRRHSQSGVFESAHDRGITVFIRSVYLQGLLVMPEDQIPQQLRAIVPVRRRLTTLAQEAGMTLQELALRYMLSQPGVSSVIVGVETVEQVAANLAFFDRGPLPRDVWTAIQDWSCDLPEMIITPSQWPPRPVV